MVDEIEVTQRRLKPAEVIKVWDKVAAEAMGGEGLQEAMKLATKFIRDNVGAGIAEVKDESVVLNE